MKWIADNCKYGDMIRVKIGTVLHYGIYVSDDEVIQFGLPPVGRSITDSAGVNVCATDIDGFACGSFVEVCLPDRKERKKRFPPDKTVRIARSRLGEGGYNALHNNCEHFANECYWGEHRSEQEQALRNKWLSRPILDVYICPISDDENVVLTPKERQAEVESVTAQNLKRQKITTWTLLESAIGHSFEYDMGELRFSRQKSGKWVCDKVWFSLSHTNEYAVVAVSNAACGVDAENKQKFLDKWNDDGKRLSFARSIAAKDNERDTDSLLRLWLKKESAYKMSGKGEFCPSKINTDKTAYAVREYDGAAVAVCGDNLSALRFFRVDGQTVTPIASEGML